MKKPVTKVELSKSENSDSGNSRRSFLKLGGLAFVGSSLLLYSCEPDNDEIFSSDAKAKGVNNKKVFNLGEGDRAILNYAYILEQLEAAFYAKVVTETGLSYTPLEDNEEQILTDIYYHEVIHREFFETALDSLFDPGEVAPNLEFDFPDIFNNRDTVLEIAQTLEDTGVSAYNGAGKLIENAAYLLLAGKIVSVEARHASAIRNLIAPGTQNFASDEVLVDLMVGGENFPNAFDAAESPHNILEKVAATGFLQTKIIANNVPTS